MDKLKPAKLRKVRVRKSAHRNVWFHYCAERGGLVWFVAWADAQESAHRCAFWHGVVQ